MTWFAQQLVTLWHSKPAYVTCRLDGLQDSCLKGDCFDDLYDFSQFY
jgi:hypothetical protein